MPNTPWLPDGPHKSSRATLLSTAKRWIYYLRALSFATCRVTSSTRAGPAMIGGARRDFAAHGPRLEEFYADTFMYAAEIKTTEPPAQ